MQYGLKTSQVGVYIAVLTCVAMVFCPIQHILEVLEVYHHLEAICCQKGIGQQKVMFYRLV